MIDKTNLGLVDWCISKLGKGYVYATYFSSIVTEALIQVKARQYPSIYTDGYIERSRKWIGHQAGDCVGLIKGYYWFDGEKVVYKLDGRPDTSANGMLSSCTEKGLISTLPEIPGVLVFMSGHVGVYIGGGYVIESRGVDYGVVKTALNGRPWVNWGKCPYISYTGGNSMLYKGCPDGEAVKEWQESLIKVGIALPNYGADGDFGGETETATNQFKAGAGLPQDGKVDEITYAKMLNKLQGISTGITQAQLAAANKTAAEYKAQLDTAKIKIATASNDLANALNRLTIATNQINQIKSAVAVIKAL